MFSKESIIKELLLISTKVLPNKQLECKFLDAAPLQNSECTARALFLIPAMERPKLHSIER